MALWKTSLGSTGHTPLNKVYCYYYYYHDFFDVYLHFLHSITIAPISCCPKKWPVDGSVVCFQQQIVALSRPQPDCTYRLWAGQSLTVHADSEQIRLYVPGPIILIKAWNQPVITQSASAIAFQYNFTVVFLLYFCRGPCIVVVSAALTLVRADCRPFLFHIKVSHWTTEVIGLHNGCTWPVL